MFSRVCLTAALAAGLVAGAAVAGPAAPNAQLTRAKGLFNGLEFAEAAAAADVAWNIEGNDRETVIEILKLQGASAAVMGQVERARTAFHALLTIEPAATLAGVDMGGKVQKPFAEAKARVAKEGSLRFEAAPAPSAANALLKLRAEAAADPLRMARAVRFWHRLPGGRWSSAEVDTQEGVATLEVVGESVEWWSQLLGEQNRVLASMGGADDPLTATRVKLSTPVPDPHLAITDPKPDPTPSGDRPYRTVSYGLWGGSVAAAGAGVFFGLRSNSARQQIDAASRNSAGRVVGMTRQEALVLDGEASSSATLANVFFGTAMALVGAGVGLYLIPGEVAVAPTPQGITVVGGLP